MAKTLGLALVGFGIFVAAPSFSQQAQKIAETARQEAARSHRELERSQMRIDNAHLKAQLLDADNARVQAEVKAAEAARAAESAPLEGAESARRLPTTTLQDNVIWVDRQQDSVYVRNVLILGAVLVPVIGAGAFGAMRLSKGCPLGDNEKLQISLLMGSLFAILLVFSLATGWASFR